MESQKYDLIFITTFIFKDTIGDLLSSIVRFDTKINVLVLVVCQNGNLIEDLESELVTIKSLSVLHILSLSAARNLAIQYLLEKQIKASHIMFPDDDSTFDDSFFDRYSSCVFGDFNYIIDVYCANSRILFKKQKLSSEKMLSRFDWSAACSVNMIISFKTFLKVGLFDENLGVGALYGAGEDNDYFIRVCEHSTGFVYDKRLYNYHPAPAQTYQRYNFNQLVRRFNSYGKGIVFCLCKHNMFFDALVICLRAFLGGVKSLMCMKFGYSIAYFSSFISRSFLLLSTMIACKSRY